MTRSARFCVVGGLAAAFACSSSPANIAGSYTVDLTDEANGCGFADWDEGSSASGIPVAIDQTGSMITVSVTGLAQVGLDLVVGSNEFAGTVDGDVFNATIVGDRPFGSGGCAYTINAAIEGSISGSTISGSINYTAETNSASACGSISGCESTQDYSGIRPPS